MAEFADFEIEQDFNDVQVMTGEFGTLPIGEYEFVVKDVVQKPSSKNNPMIVCTFEVAGIIDVPNHPNPEQLIGLKAWGNYPLLQQSLGRLKALMVACGTNLDKFRAGELIEAHFRASVVHNQGNAQVGQDGQPLPAKIFANVVNERPLEVAAPEPAKAPPVTKAAAKAPAAARKA